VELDALVRAEMLRLYRPDDILVHAGFAPNRFDMVLNKMNRKRLSGVH